jgi:[acyl-carrier-protein] S-malonyltransferase
MDAQKTLKCSYVFPGQGVQAVGMGEELRKKSKAARLVFQEADDSLGFSLSRLMFKGPAADLQDTINSQPAIMAVCIAFWKAWEEFLGTALEPDSVAGHSLGEYSSMVVAGVIDFGDAVRLVRERGRLMHQASLERPGGMAAIIGLDELAFEHICAETGVELANINSDDQIVISGDKIAVARAMDLSLARGARKAVPLPVSGAFHSSLMYEAEQSLAEAVDKLEFRHPKMPIIANSTGKPLITSQDVKEELVNGLCSTVRWSELVRYMVNSGVTRFLEFGPIRLLASFIRRIDSTVEAVTLSSREEMRKLVPDHMKRRRVITAIALGLGGTALALAAGGAVVAHNRRKSKRNDRGKES